MFRANVGSLFGAERTRASARSLVIVETADPSTGFAGQRRYADVEIVAAANNADDWRATQIMSKRIHGGIPSFSFDNPHGRRQARVCRLLN